MTSVVISMCDRTGNMVRPWANAGWECWCVDLQHSIRTPRVVQIGAGLIRYVWGDARSWYPPSHVRPGILFAFPPCTHLAVSGARDFTMKAGWMLADALQVFDSCQAAAVWAGCPYMIENPVGRLSSHRRKPDYIFHPWEYAGYLSDQELENTTKKTCLWTGGGFVMPAKKPAAGLHRHDCHMASPGDDRGDIRSVTPMGFAEAVFAANHNIRAFDLRRASAEVIST